MQSIRTTTDSDGVLTFWIDVPDKPVNTIGPQVLADMNAALDEIERNPPKAMIIASPKARSFVAGADLFEIRKLDRAAVEQFLALGQKTFDRIAKLSIPTVAAINGDCLGGGLELALACTYRVAADSATINIGLPEVKLGILPGWGGTVRLPRRIGLVRALPLMLAGKTMPPRRAMKAGIVEEVVRPEALQSAAKRVALASPKHAKAPLFSRVAAALPFGRSRIFAAARKETQEQTHGHYPAPMRLIDVVKTGYEKGPAAGFDAERAGLLDLMETDAARSLMRLFFLRQGSKKWISQQVNAKPREVTYAAVIGGGTMGAGIVHSLVKAGIQTRLIEVDAKAAAAGLGRVRKMLEDDAKGGRIAPLDAKNALLRVSPSTEWSGLKLCDVVIEAVIEKMELKREVFAKLDKLVRPDCVLATNTSSLSVTEMAAATEHPQRVVGLHFFNPVPKMPLVEVVRTAHSDDASLATAAGVASKIGKTPILVVDAPGFLVNRVLIPYLAEALMMATEGRHSIVTIDAAMKDWGMPMGPFELLDEIGLDVSAHVLRSLAEQTGDSRVLPAAVDEALKRGWLGKKSGRGFYVHEKGSKGPLPANQELTAMIAPKATASPPAPQANGDRAAEPDRGAFEAIQWRLVLPMVNEAAKLLDEGVVHSAEAVDLAMVLGTGFAPHRGGLVRFADSVGSDQLVAKLDALAKEHGPRFEPAPMLRRLAEGHRMLSEYQATKQPAESASAEATTSVAAQS